MTDITAGTSEPVLATGTSGRAQKRARPPRKPRRPLRPRTLFAAVAAYLVAIIFIVPYLDMFVTAMRPINELQQPNILPHHWTWSNFSTIWSTGFGASFRVSLEVAAGSTVLVLLVALPAAYYTARKQFRGRSVFLLLVLVTQMFQPPAMLVGIYKEFLSFNLLNTVFSLILVNAGFNLAFAVWILNAYFSSIPVELEDAAMVDGTSRLGALVRITLPLALPGVVTALIFSFIAAWNEFIVALTLNTTPNTQPLTVNINGYIGQYQIDWGHLFAGSVIATVPVIILFAIIEGKVVSGLTAGSVK
ncbi:carbohydrate ABC transporter permease [Leekyejoonella antrihumi]|uniref:Carbohydrate ABC transporter permease n=1 Tax=Leekyejoonella antrihumi TaxID=1660198 RepID=A0A563E1R2_9MICO|nr:carbohydrate ABC transporter permease [Leekyejoonella antrihumi]TWP36480.1 carbohydrate ABC transporter permease [Leekyejoonella antrihumi]